MCQPSAVPAHAGTHGGARAAAVWLHIHHAVASSAGTKRQESGAANAFAECVGPTPADVTIAYAAMVVMVVQCLSVLPSLIDQSINYN